MAISESFSPSFCSVDRWKDIGNDDDVATVLATLPPVIVVAGLPALAVSLES